MAAPKGNKFAAGDRRGRPAIERFISFCQFQPETGCVVWIGGKTKGRGHHVDYGSFWFEGRRWFAHRWAAKFIHGLDIDGFDVDHKCPALTIPNTLCVEHLQSITPARNRELQTMRRMIHLQVGLERYEDVYGPEPDPDELADLIPFYDPPAWLGAQHGSTLPHPAAVADCPF